MFIQDEFQKALAKIEVKKIHFDFDVSLSRLKIRKNTLSFVVTRCATLSLFDYRLVQYSYVSVKHHINQYMSKAM